MTPSQLAFALTVLQALPGLIAAGKDVAGLLQKTANSLTKMQAEGREPTAEEWADMNTIINDLRAILHS